MLYSVDQGLEVLPVLNKVDLPQADPDKVRQEIEDVVGIEALEAPEISAKSGLNDKDVLEQLVEKIPAPKTMKRH